MINIDEFVEINELFEIYKDLLTKKQRQVMELYFAEDLGFSEIGKNLNISRQAVYDTVRKVKKSLYRYEEKLCVKKLREENEYLKKSLNK